jgi:hypothetical protein
MGLRLNAERHQLQTERLTVELRDRCPSQPGATEEAFQAVLPALLDERRKADAAAPAEVSRRHSRNRLSKLL